MTDFFYSRFELRFCSTEVIDYFESESFLDVVFDSLLDLVFDSWLDLVFDSWLDLVFDSWLEWRLDLILSCLLEFRDLDGDLLGEGFFGS